MTLTTDQLKIFSVRLQCCIGDYGYKYVKAKKNYKAEDAKEALCKLQYLIHAFEITSTYVVGADYNPLTETQVDNIMQNAKELCICSDFCGAGITEDEIIITKTNCD